MRALLKKNQKKHTPVRTQVERSLAKRDSHVVNLFCKMARAVPAYKHFLSQKKIRPASVSRAFPIHEIPIMGKSNYLRTFPYKNLFWDESLKTPHVMTSTSGSTGEPFYFGRATSVDEQSALIHERFFLQSSLSKTKPTLVIVCFGMGVWIGGLITYQAFQLLGKRGHPISIITPGINKTEILKTLRLLAPSYEQVIFAGYPPFIKDVLDEAKEDGISFGNLRVAVVFAAEAFTEQFRDYIAEKAGIQNALTDTMNIYGSADLGTMAFETPLSILVRRLALGHKEFFADLFGGIEKTPTLAQFIPSYVSFEEIGGELLVSGDSAMPLVRYAIGDHGGVRSHEHIVALAKKHGIDLRAEMAAAHISRQQTELPFVYVYERIDLSTTLYGLQVYPETIREVLERPAFSPFITARFTLTTKFDEQHDQYLEINIELRREKTATDALSSHVGAEIVKNLMQKNGEFRELARFLGKRAEPRLVFWPHEDPQYFRRDVKQKWVIRS